MEVTTTVENLVQGDEFWADGVRYWTAVGNAERLGSGETIVRVQHADGGTTTRAWDTGTEITIERAEVGSARG